MVQYHGYYLLLLQHNNNTGQEHKMKVMKVINACRLFLQYRVGEYVTLYFPPIIALGVYNTTVSTVQSDPIYMTYIA